MGKKGADNSHKVGQSSCPHRLTAAGEPVKPIDEQLKTTVLVADKRRGTDLKQIGRIRVEWAGTGELVACRWEESRVTFEDAKLAFTHIYPDIYPP